MQALVLTPTRELCIQVTQAIRAYASRKGADVVAVFGGAPIRTQQAQLKAGGHIVVGTVGRVMDLINRRSLILQSCRFVVLDEADEMLDLGFLEDVEKILRLTPNSRQTALFSATMPPPIPKLADNYLYDPVLVKVQSATLTVDSVEQFHVESRPPTRPTSSSRSSSAEKPDQAIVFARTKIRTDQLYKKLRDRGLNVKALHGDMTQGSRDGVMLGFKGGRVPILVATDVAARGLDISTVTHVVNYDVPRSPDVYVHRIGRTGRVGRAGRAITFVEPKQEKELEAIEKHVGTAISPWTPGAHVAPPKITEKPQAPHQATAQAQRRRAVRQAHRQRRALRGHRGRRPRRRGHARRGVDGEAVRDVKVLEHFAFLSVPAADAERIASAIDGERVRRTAASRAEPARSSAPLTRNSGRRGALPFRPWHVAQRPGRVLRRRPDARRRRTGHDRRPCLRGLRRRHAARPGLVPGVRHRGPGPARRPSRLARRLHRRQRHAAARRRRRPGELRGADQRRRAHRRRAADGSGQPTPPPAPPRRCRRRR